MMSQPQQPSSMPPEAYRYTVGQQSISGEQGKPRALAEHELPPEVRKQIQERMSQRGVQGGSGAVVRTTTEGEQELPPQFIGRTVTEKYLDPSEVPGLVQQTPPPNGILVGQVGQTGTGGNMSPGRAEKIKQIQNVVAPVGSNGRIEETIYIQRPRPGVEGSPQ